MMHIFLFYFAIGAGITGNFALGALAIGVAVYLKLDDVTPEGK